MIMHNIIDVDVIDVVHEKLDTAPWLVQLTTTERAVYVALRAAELEWLQAFEKAGAILIPGGGRQVAVAVPPDMPIPPWAKLVSVLDDWRDILKAAALNQDKKLGIGDRSTAYPVWLGDDGKNDCAIEDRPDYCADEIRFRTYRAYRGAKLSPSDIVGYLARRVKAIEAHIDNSEANNNHKRADEQRVKQADLIAAFAKVQALIDVDDVVSARICSGHGFRVYVSGANVGFSASLASIALIPSITNVIVKAASTRQRTHIETFFYAADVELSIKRPSV